MAALDIEQIELDELEELLDADDGRGCAEAVLRGLRDADAPRRVRALTVVMWLIDEIAVYFDGGCVDRSPRSQQRVIGRVGGVLGDALADSSTEVRRMASEAIVALSRLGQWRTHLASKCDSHREQGMTRRYGQSTSVPAIVLTRDVVAHGRTWLVLGLAARQESRQCVSDGCSRPPWATWQRDGCGSVQ